MLKTILIYYKLNVTMFNFLHMLIIVVGHLFMWFIHVLGGGKAILLLFATHHVHCIIHFALEVMLCT
jgi:hypothetical protein